MLYREVVPRAELAPFVKCFWFLAADEPGGPVERIVPDGCTEIVVNRADPFVGVDRDGLQPRVMLVGQLRGFLRIRPTGAVDLAGVRFRPGGFWPFLAVPQAELAEERPDLGDVCRRLRRDLRAAFGGARGPERAERVLLDRLRPRRGRAAEAARLLEAADGRVPIGAVVARLGANARTLERAFAREVGLRPKLLARVLRFQGVIRAVESTGRPDWVRLALDGGYCDQSHLVRDFRAFSGLSPTRYFATEHPMADYFAGLGPDAMST